MIQEVLNAAFAGASIPVVLGVMLWLLMNAKRDILETHETTLVLSAGIYVALHVIAWAALASVTTARRGDDFLAATMYSVLPCLAIAAYFASDHYFIKGHRLRPLKDSDPCPPAARRIDILSSRLSLAHSPRLYISEVPGTSPFVFGRVLRPALALPKDFHAFVKELSHKTGAPFKDLQDFILLHELSHIRHRDYSFISWGVCFISFAFRYWMPLYALVWIDRLLREPMLFPLTALTRSMFVFIIPLGFLSVLFVSANRKREVLADARAGLFLPPASLAALLDHSTHDNPSFTPLA